MCNIRKRTKTARELLTLMTDDKLVEKDDKGQLFNKMCRGCENDCTACAAFGLSCFIDNLIAFHSGKTKILTCSLKRYHACKGYVDKFKELNNGRMVALGCDDEMKDTAESLKRVICKDLDIAASDIRYDVMSEYFSSKKRGQVEVNGFQLPYPLYEFLKNNKAASRIGDLTLIAAIISSCGIYGIMVRDMDKGDNSIVPMVRAMARFSDCLLFNLIDDNRRVFQPISFDNTILFSDEQIRKALCLRERN